MKRRFNISFFMAVFLAWMSVGTAIAQSVQAVPEDGFLSTDQVHTLKRSSVKANSPTNAGTEFYFSMPPSYFETGGIGDDVYLYISSGVATQVIVEVKSDAYQIVRTTIPNSIISVRVPANVAEPYSKTATTESPACRVYKSKAIHILADDPVIVYAVSRRQFTSDALLAFPVSALGNDYSIGSFEDYPFATNYFLPSEATVTATQNNTKVIFTLGGNSLTQVRFSDGAVLRPGQTKTFTMQQGDVLALASFNFGADLAGSTLAADKPIAVVGGVYCAALPRGVVACDYICEMELPKNTWGTVYHVTPILTRLKNSWIRIFAKEPNTTVYRDGLELATIRKAGGTLGEGWWDGRVADAINGVRSYTISSDKPISISQFNPGQSDDNVVSDPFQLVLTPIEQYQYDFVFATPGLPGSNEGFTSNYVNIVFEADVDGAGTPRVPSGLEIGEQNGGDWSWKNIANVFGSTILPSDRFTVASGTGNPRVDDKVFGGKRLTLNQGTVYRIRSNKPTAAYVYGFSNYDSYGNPTSVALADLSKPDTVAPSVTYSVGCNGNVTDGVVSDLPDVDSVRSNLAAITLVRPDSSYNYRLTFDKFVPGTDYKTNWRLTVLDPSKDARAQVLFTDRAGNATTIIVEYKALSIEFDPKNIDFGVVNRNTPATQEIKVKNLGNSPLDVKRFGLKFGANFTLNPTDTTFVLAASGQPGSIKTFTVRFQGSEENTYVDSVGLGNACLFFYRPQLKAKIGRAVISVEPDLNFDQVTVGTNSAPKRFSVRNTGTIDLTVTGMNGQNMNSKYSIQPSRSGLTYPYVLKPLQSEDYTVTYSPTGKDSDSERLTFSSDATEGDSVENIIGRGIAPGLEVRGVTWNRWRVGRTANIDSVVVKNTGTAPLIINKATLRSGGTSSEFTINLNEFELMQLNSLEQKSVLVTFSPTSVGDKQIDIDFETNTASVTGSASVRGTGVDIAVKTADIDFTPVTAFIDGDNAIRKSVDISIDKSVFGVYTDDTLRIDGLVLTGLVENSGNPLRVLSNQGEYPRGGSPVYLVKGVKESVTITGEYEPLVGAQHSGKFDVISDASNSTSSTWSGRRLSSGIIVSPSVEIEGACQGSGTKVATFTVTNIQGNTTITSIDAENTPGSMYAIKASNLPYKFSSPGEAYTFTVEYTHTIPGTQVLQLVVKNTAVGQEEERRTVTGTTYPRVETGTTLKVSYQSEKNEPGSRFMASISHTNTIDASSGVTDINYVFDYNKSAFSVEKSGIVSKVPGMSVKNVSVTSYGSSQNRLTFSLSGNTAVTVPSGVVVEIPMQSYLSDSIGKSLPLYAGIDIPTGGSTCKTISGSASSARVGEVCVSDLRNVVVGGTSYYVRQNYPNPSEGGKTTIEYGVGIEGVSKLEILDQHGSVVKTIVSGVQSPGVYSVEVDVKDLPSGAYIYRYESGAYKEVRTMTVLK